MSSLVHRYFQPRCSSVAIERAIAGGSGAGLSAVLDEAALSRLRELDPSGSNRLMARVLTSFESSLARLMPLLVQAQAAQDCSGIRHVTHTLKSSSASIGALHLTKLCAELEAMARSGELEGLHKMEARVGAVRAEAEMVLTAFKQSLEARS